MSQNIPLGILNSIEKKDSNFLLTFSCGSSIVVSQLDYSTFISGFDGCLVSTEVTLLEPGDFVIEVYSTT